MADWTNLPNQAVGVGGLPSGTTVTALRDNPVAIAEGAPGAPRIVDGALATTATNAGRNWVLARNALAQAGAVGTWALLQTSTEVDLGAGSTRAGSGLLYTNAHGGSPSGSPSGTWRLMGKVGGSFLPSRVSVWLRIS